MYWDTDAPLQFLLKTSIFYYQENVLFNDVLETLYVRLYSILHMVKDQAASESERKPAVTTTWATLVMSSKRLFVRTILRTVQHIPRSLLHQERDVAPW